MVAFAVRLMRRRAVKQKSSFALTFLDLKSAFHTVVREFAMGAWDSRELCALFQRLDMPESSVATMRSWVESRGSVMSSLAGGIRESRR